MTEDEPQLEMKEKRSAEHLREQAWNDLGESRLEQYAFMCYIPGNVPSSKNAKRFIPAKGLRGPMLISNETTQRYKRFTGIVYQSEKDRFRRLTAHLEFPLCIEFEFHRDSNRHFDLINATQIVQDMMVTHGMIDDDDSLHVIPYYKPARVLKNHPGVWIRVIDTKNYKQKWIKKGWVEKKEQEVIKEFSTGIRNMITNNPDKTEPKLKEDGTD